MSNYKPFTNQTIMAAGVITFVPPNAKIIHLFENTDLAGAPDTFQTVGTVTDYECPSNKKFVPIRLEINQIAINGFLKIYSGDSADDIASGLVFDILLPSYETKHEIHVGHIDFGITSSKAFLVSDPSAANIEHLSIIGYEVDL